MFEVGQRVKVWEYTYDHGLGSIAEVTELGYWVRLDGYDGDFLLEGECYRFEGE